MTECLIARPEIASQWQDILVAFPLTKTLISFVCRMNRKNDRSLARSLVNYSCSQPTLITNIKSAFIEFQANSVSMNSSIVIVKLL
ncbi:hypothetical protein [Nostoc sp. CHAB 5715]|uniref:hypothetical protein n=1 Tax=Nostoc sp. CHAB 5715 TaxID=2780400 RepID=UPI001E4F17F6|nr:hypothetical protein [Nostoc sp. CHAB 5715]MCC5625520.1 hypothetical protein [Nostoc sp. CHAB 5715]